MTKQGEKQGVDGINFVLELKDLENIKLPDKYFFNEDGKNFIKIEQHKNKIGIYINLPNGIRNNNVRPFTKEDFSKLCSLRRDVINKISLYLRENLNEHYSDELLNEIKLKQIECNITHKCEDKCKVKNIINLFERSFNKTTVYKEAGKGEKNYKKSERGMTYKKEHEFFIKVYDKTFEQMKDGNLKVDKELVRIEIVFLDRMIKRMYSNENTIEKILTEEALEKLFKQYEIIFDEICDNYIKPFLTSSKKEFFKCLVNSSSGNRINDAVIICKDFIVDLEVIRPALKEWYRIEGREDDSRQIIKTYSEKMDKYNFPLDTLKNLKKIHTSIKCK